MKKRLLVPILIWLLFMLTLSFIYGSIITGDAITGKATSQLTNVSVFILPSSPTLAIISPKNGTYLVNISLLLNFTSSLADNFWYNLDFGNNASVSSPAYFNTSAGSHSLYLYANNSAGITAANVNFSINLTLLIINYTKYQTASGGNSTDFYSYTFEELQNISGVCIENTNYGKICFNEPINITADSIPNDGIVEINNNTNLSTDHIELNSVELPNFNKSATIWIYNLSFINPRILRNGVVCPASICTAESYTGGTLKFNVTGFTVYSAEESPVAVSIGGGGGRYVFVYPNETRVENITQ